MRFVFAFLAMLLMAVPAMASTLITNGLGQLTGIADVTINGTNYDVSFRGGTCADIFSGCDGSTFTFTNDEDAAAASWAVMQAIEASPLFDAAPWLTLGCANPTCIIDVPFTSNAGIVFNEAAYNESATSVFPDDVMPDSFYASLDYGGSRTFALFSSPAAVPELSTWAMMLLGFVGIGLSRRHGRRAIGQLA